MEGGPLGDLGKIMESYGGARIFLLGDSVMDQFIRGTVSHLSPEAPVPVVDVEENHTLIGAAANTASNIIKQGGKVYLNTVVGDDDPGAQLRRMLEELEIDTIGVLTDQSRDTTTKLRISASKWLGVDHEVVRVDREQTHPLSDELAQKVLSNWDRVSDDVDAVLLADYGKGAVTTMLAQELIQRATQKNIPVIASMKVNQWVNPAESFRGADLAILGLTGYQLLKGQSRRDTSVADDGGLREKFAWGAIMVIRHVAGCVLLDEAGRFGLPSTQTKPRSDTGVRDALSAVASLALGKGASTRDAMILSAYAGDLALGDPETVPISRTQLQERLEELDWLGRISEK